MRWMLAALMLAPNLADAADSSTSGITREVVEAFAEGVFRGERLSLPYRLHSPAGAGDGDPRPLLVFLHGYGERGDDNVRQLVHGGKLFASPEFQEKHGAFVLAPQCPAVKRLGSDKPLTWSMNLWPTEETPRTDIGQTPSAALQAVQGLVTELIATKPIDPKRVYVMGLSMGGYGTWELAARDPQRFAAAAPVCGGGNPAWAERLKGLPVWAFHGDADGAVPVERMREMVAALEAAGGKLQSTEYPGVGHDSWTPTFQSPEFWDWLFEQRR